MPEGEGDNDTLNVLVGDLEFDGVNVPRLIDVETLPDTAAVSLKLWLVVTLSDDEKLAVRESLVEYSSVLEAEGVALDDSKVDAVRLLLGSFDGDGDGVTERDVDQLPRELVRKLVCVAELDRDTELCCVTLPEPERLRVRLKDRESLVDTLEVVLADASLVADCDPDEVTVLDLDIELDWSGVSLVDAEKVGEPLTDREGDEETVTDELTDEDSEEEKTLVSVGDSLTVEDSTPDKEIVPDTVFDGVTDDEGDGVTEKLALLERLCEALIDALRCSWDCELVSEGSLVAVIVGDNVTVDSDDHESVEDLEREIVGDRLGE